MTNTAIPHQDLTYRIIGADMRVHRRTPRGLREQHYQKALTVELTQNGLAVSEDHPIEVYDALASCAWLTEKMRKSEELKADEAVRLPIEAEWEKAGRGEYGNEWPWGNEWEAGKCNSSESKIGTTTPVGQYSPAGDSRQPVRGGRYGRERVGVVQEPVPDIPLSDG